LTGFEMKKGEFTNVYPEGKASLVFDVMLYAKRGD